MNAWSAAHGDKKDWRANDVDAILHAERRASSTSVGNRSTDSTIRSVVAGPRFPGTLAIKTLLAASS